MARKLSKVSQTIRDHYPQIKAYLKTHTISETANFWGISPVAAQLVGRFDTDEERREYLKNASARSHGRSVSWQSKYPDVKVDVTRKEPGVKVSRPSRLFGVTFRAGQSTPVLASPFESEKKEKVMDVKHKDKSSYYVHADVKELKEKAIKLAATAKSHAEVAKKLKITVSRLNNWRKNDKTFSTRYQEAFDASPNRTWLSRNGEIQAHNAYENSPGFPATLANVTPKKKVEEKPIPIKKSDDGDTNVTKTDEAMEEEPKTSVKVGATKPVREKVVVKYVEVPKQVEDKESESEASKAAAFFLKSLGWSLIILVLTFAICEIIKLVK